MSLQAEIEERNSNTADFHQTYCEQQCRRDSQNLHIDFFLSDERKGEKTDLELLSVYREYGVIPNQPSLCPV